jgi:hypothetical protein
MNLFQNLVLFVCIISIFTPIGVSNAQLKSQTPSLVFLNGIPIKKVMSDIEGTELVARDGTGT